MKLKLLITNDGSHTYRDEVLNELYHSMYGAIQESEYVYIENGLKKITKKIVSIFEMGFGTGLNAFLTLKFALLQEDLQITYTSIELNPLNKEQYECLNYKDYFPADIQKYFFALHESEWEISVNVLENFSLHKTKADIRNYTFENSYDLIYYDAFCPAVQPDLWKEQIFRNIYNATRPNGIFVTYSASGFVRRNLERAGFLVKKIKGPPGKIHMLQALKKTE